MLDWLRSLRISSIRADRTLRQPRSSRQVPRASHRDHRVADVCLLEARTMLAAGYPELVDPHAAPGNDFGTEVVVLSTGNIVVTAPGDDTNGVDSGAVYLFDGFNGKLISELHGASAGDSIGSAGITALPNGNFLVRSPSWADFGHQNVGAVTFGNGLTGIQGVVSASNSLVGFEDGNLVGSEAPTVLTNGNYVISTPSWGTFNFAGAATFGDGTTGVSGVISSTNSLIGLNDNDGANMTVIPLSTGNYLVRRPNWHEAGTTGLGAVTFGNGTTGTSGVVSATNSLVGSSGNDHIGSNGITPLPNGNYLVSSLQWDNGSAVDAGAVTFGSGTTGVSGAVSAANSLVGSSALDFVGASGTITVLTNGNYVVQTPNWNNATDFDAGAVTFGSATSGVSGVITAANSLIGETAFSKVGSYGVKALANGNYVVVSPEWSVGSTAAVGAVTFGDGLSGINGAVSAANSLVGTHSNDRVGLNGIYELTNGNYLVGSEFWANGSAGFAGAVTFASGTSGIAGAVNSLNSLVGTTFGDHVGNGITTLSNGNYVVTSLGWDNQGQGDAGAVTFGNGTTGIVGTVSETNSLVGTTAFDQVGNFGIEELTNGNFVVRSPYWDNGNLGDSGAATFVNGMTGLTGPISAANSLVSDFANGLIGYDGVTSLTNGNYVVVSAHWDSATNSDVGAVTLGNGTTGTSGAVSSTNSLVGASDFDYVGEFVTVLPNSNFVVRSPHWSNGLANSAGAVTFSDGSTGTTGVVSVLNSLVGTHANDSVGNGAPQVLSNGNYVIQSYYWDDGVHTDVGAVTFGSATTGVKGEVSAANSLVGSSDNDLVGSGIVTTLANGNFLVSNGQWDNGLITDAGALTFGDGATGVKGVISAANSLVGSSPSDQVGLQGVTAFANGNYAVVTPNYNGSEGAVTFGNGTSGVTGVPNTNNSIFGSNSSVGLGESLTLDNVNNNFLSRFLADGGGRVRAGSQLSGFANVVPVIGGTVNNQSVNDNATISPYATLTVADSDSQAMFARVTVLNGIVRGDFTAASTTGWTRTVVGNDLKYERYFPQHTDIGSVVQTAVRGFVFQPRTNAIAPGATELIDLALYVTDGQLSASNTTRIVTTSINDAPTLGGAVANQAVNDNATINPFATATVADPDKQDMFVRVTIDSGVVRGDFTAASTSGWTRTVVGNNILYERYYAPQANIGGVVQTAIRSLVFQPRSSVVRPNGTESTLFSLYVTDGQSSASNSTTSVRTTSLNDAPAISGTVANQSVNDDATSTPFASVVITDPDAQDMFSRITISNGTLRGDFTVASAGGWARTVRGNDVVYERYFNAQSNIGSVVQAAIRSLVFQPRANSIRPGLTEATAFSLYVTDGIASTTDTTTRVTTTSLNNVPVIGGTVANQSVASNETLAVFQAVTVNDLDTQDILGRVTVTNGMNRGDLTAASTVGWSRNVVGTDIVYSQYFAPATNVGAAVQTAIRSLIFQPRSSLPVGWAETTDFKIYVQDGSGANATDSTTSVVTTGVAAKATASSLPASSTPLILVDDTTVVVLPSSKRLSASTV